LLLWEGIDVCGNGGTIHSSWHNIFAKPVNIIDGRDYDARFRSDF
jgi:hypothetical protein